MAGAALQSELRTGHSNSPDAKCHGSDWWTSAADGSRTGQSSSAASAD